MCNSNLNQIFNKATESLNNTFTVNDREFNLADMGWSITKLKSRTTWGRCSPRNKTISLSTWLIENTNRTIKEWNNTILHEIAHAIDFEIRGTSDHSIIWKKIALSIGCNGKRCSDGDIDALASKYRLHCKNCGQNTPSHKKLKVRYACSNCCDKYAGGKFSSRYILEQIENKKQATIKTSAPTEKKSVERRKLTWSDVNLIRANSASGVRNSELAKVYGVTPTCIWNIVQHKTWKV